MKKIRNRDLWKKCGVTLLILILIQVVSAFPTPGVNTKYFDSLLNGNAAYSFLNALTGNSLSKLSILTLGITPYISASIIVQLLGFVIPYLMELQKGGQSEQDKLEWINIGAGAALAAVQSSLMAYGFGKRGLLIDYKWYWIVLVALIWTASSTLLAILGKTMTKHLIGNGVSLILAANILVSFPGDVMRVYYRFIHGKKIAPAITTGIIIVAFVFLIFMFTILIQEGTKKIPVTYSGKYANAEIPIKLCPGGVMPVIFASTIMSMPVLVAQFLGKENAVIRILNSGSWFKPERPTDSIGAIVYIILILAFSSFYSEIVFNPLEVANNLKKSGGTIPGIRPGTPTSDYLKKEMRWLVSIGAAALAIIALIPLIVSGLTGLGNLSFLGTSIIIVIGVILETTKQIQSQAQNGIYMQKVRKGVFSMAKNRNVLRRVRAELKRVSFPKLSETIKMSAYVLVISIVFAALLSSVNALSANLLVHLGVL